jgi:RNA polymerase sigma-70 factor (ECF subfamily)
MVRISQPLLRQLIGRTFRAEEDIEEVLQDIYLSVHRALPSFAGRSKFSTWLYGLARHKIFDSLGKRIRHRREISMEPPDSWQNQENHSHPDPASPWDCPPDEHFHRQAIRSLAESALSSIPEDYRQVFLLREREGLTGEEASHRLGCSAIAVRVKLHRARQMLAKQVREALELTPSLNLC